MAPPRRIVRQQLEILIDYLEANKDMCKGLSPGAPLSHQTTRQKWSAISKQLNAVQSGALKTPDGWKKYWFEWRHKCRRKAVDGRRFDSDSNRFIPLNDLEVRVLDLSGKGAVRPVPSTSIQLDNFLADDSDSEPLENVKVKRAPVNIKVKKFAGNTRTSTDNDSRAMTPPPKWALEIEERRIAAEERMADALESMAAVMRARDDRRALLDERVADALAAIAGTVQDLNSGVQEAVQHLQHLHPIPNEDIKDVFI